MTRDTKLDAKRAASTTPAERFMKHKERSSIRRSSFPLFPASMSKHERKTFTADPNLPYSRTIRVGFSFKCKDALCYKKGKRRRTRDDDVNSRSKNYLNYFDRQFPHPRVTVFSNVKLVKARRRSSNNCSSLRTWQTGAVALGFHHLSDRVSRVIWNISRHSAEISLAKISRIDICVGDSAAPFHFTSARCEI